MSEVLTELRPEPPSSLQWGAIWHLGMGSTEGGQVKVGGKGPWLCCSQLCCCPCGCDTRVTVQRASPVLCSALCHPHPGLLFPFFLGAQQLCGLSCVLGSHDRSAGCVTLCRAPVVLEPCLPAVSCWGRHISCSQEAVLASLCPRAGLLALGGDSLLLHPLPTDKDKTFLLQGDRGPASTRL